MDITTLAHADSLELLAMEYGEEKIAPAPAPIVTRESLMMLLTATRDRQMHVVGRALVALFKRQTDDEQRGLVTKHDNGRGFSAPDARTGSIGAKHYAAHKSLPDGLFASWMRTENGFPRIVKYAKQLNEIALAKSKG